MSLILVVEPDRRQAAHLTHVVRQRVGAELILAETTELALASIGNRVPDLILVPALLSPQDDAALAAALRVIATAAHVQMLTTPLFASAPPEPRRGVLSAFRRAKPAKASIDGCDPAEFAQQISSYLESAAEERAAAQYTEAPVQVAAPVVAHTSQPYAPLEPGRLYRDEAVAYREIETTPEIEAISEAAVTLPEPEPVAASAAPVAALEAAELIDHSTPAIYEAIEAVSETPDAWAIAEPVAISQEPILEAPEPILETLATIVEIPAPSLKTSEPVLELPEAVLEVPEAVLEMPEAVLEMPEPFVEIPEPFVEIPEPLAATEPTHARRIGFVMREETEPIFAPLSSEPFVTEVDPIEIAASAETAFTIEAIAEQEPVATPSEPIVDEAIELLEVVDDSDVVDNDDQADVGTIDLSAEFEELQAVEEQSDVEAMASIEAFDVEAEIAADDTEAIEVLETPEIVEAVEAAAPRLHLIEVDALKEFAATVEAMTAVEPIAVAAADAFEFDDLFPRREPVEPSPLGAWHSWATLEGMAAEASEAPVPAHVVERATERAVERAPERPEWVQLVESLRIDVERRRSEQPADAAKPARKTPSRPVQDEWGLFDPAQCGFAALLSKLDEITDASESRPRRSA
jgi:hypothetical protein